MYATVPHQQQLRLIYRADEDADNPIIDWDEATISTDYENYVEELYTR
jgi:hypothetical protein